MDWYEEICRELRAKYILPSFFIFNVVSDLLSPSPSPSKASIILRSSSSLVFSPSSLATRFRFLRLMVPDSSSSKSRKAFRISSLGSRSKIRSLTAHTVPPARRHKSAWTACMHLEGCWRLLTHFAEVLKGYFARSSYVIVLQDLHDIHLLHLEAQSSHRHLMSKQITTGESPPEQGMSTSDQCFALGADSQNHGTIFFFKCIL